MLVAHRNGVGGMSFPRKVQRVLEQFTDRRDEGPEDEYRENCCRETLHRVSNLIGTALPVKPRYTLG